MEGRGTPDSPNTGCDAANPTCNGDGTKCQCNGEVCDAGSDKPICNSQDTDTTSDDACEACKDGGNAGTGLTQGNCPADLVCDASGGCSGTKWKGLKYNTFVDNSYNTFHRPHNYTSFG